jgi:hypothetical protein
MQKKISYSEKLKDPRWQKLRLEVFERDGFECCCCHDTESTLNVHHLKYSSGNPWDSDIKDLITYCETCHKSIEYLCSFYKEDRENLRKAYYVGVKDNSGGLMLLNKDDHFVIIFSALGVPFFAKESVGSLSFIASYIFGDYINAHNPF